MLSNVSLTLPHASFIKEGASLKEDKQVVTFVSFFLSLVVGPQPVTLAVSDPVVAVEIQLDGKSLATLRGEPWTLYCDFGPRLEPHELVAIGLDHEGREVVRKTQWINMPKKRTSLDLLLENNPQGPPQNVRVVWQSVEGKVPTSLQVTFDDTPLPITDPQSISLPPYDPSELHVIAAELRFGTRVHRTEITLGGVYGEVIKTELTAIPVQYTGRKPPSLDELDSWFLKAGTPLKVSSIEKGPATIVMVQDPSSRFQDQLRRLGRSLKSHTPRGLRRRDNLHILLPIARETGNTTVPVELFPLSRALRPLTGLLNPIIRRFNPSDPTLWDLAEENPRIRDAVALAGLEASATGRPRAVILMTSEGAKDLSRFEAEEVRHFLTQLRVPLVVWSPFEWENDSKMPWGPVQETTSQFLMGRSVEKVMGILRKQAIVWVEGLHLPQQVELSPQAAERLHLAGTPMEP